MIPGNNYMHYNNLIQLYYTRATWQIKKVKQ